ncbi:MAG: hypothetical protein E4G92_04900, partial [Bacteroidia bacterium]
MAKKKTWTMFALLVIVSLAWLAFVKPEQDKQQALADSGAVADTYVEYIQTPAEAEPKFLDGLKQFWAFTGFRNATSGHLIMMVIGLVFIFLAIR